MGEQVNIYDARTRLSQLVDRAEAGEEIIIARGGRPAARLVPARYARSSLVVDGRSTAAEDFARALASPENDVVVSAASVWEIVIKHMLGRIGSTSTK